MDWNCKISDERLSEYLDGKLPPPMPPRLQRTPPAARIARNWLPALADWLARCMSSPKSKSRRSSSKTSSTRRSARALKRKAGRTGSPGCRSLWQPRFAMGIVTVAASLTIVIHSTGITPAKTQARRLEPREHLPLGESAAASHLRAQREICERPPRRLRNSVAAATRSRAFAQFSACARAKAIATGSFHAAAKVR